MASLGDILRRLFSGRPSAPAEDRPDPVKPPGPSEAPAPAPEPGENRPEPTASPGPVEPPGSIEPRE
jgi:hypothetical protein